MWWVKSSEAKIMDAHHRQRVDSWKRNDAVDIDFHDNR
jgi:hypothetical protein